MPNDIFLNLDGLADRMAFQMVDAMTGEGLAALQASVAAGTFFGMCPYFTYLFRRP